MNIIKLIKNMFKIAKLMSVDDSGDFQFATVSTLGKTQKVLMLKPYGLMSNPPTSSMVALWNQQGQESNGIGIADDPKNRILKDMAEGEVALGNYLTNSYIVFDENSDALLTTANDANIAVLNDVNIFAVNDIVLFALSGKCSITAPTIEMNGSSDNLVTWTDLNTVMQAWASLYNGHKHGGGVNDSPVSLNLTGAKATTLKTDG
jgi:phage gp45-like